ncbi:hypothetical protein VNO80_17285 [Phaseolus coccineus]|uniref:Uncharacterized protein n=1 Tax=Phaseolus coccineus TaxID=3886 RepID=A0AAN9MP40_PHACN
MVMNRTVKSNDWRRKRMVNSKVGRSVLKDDDKHTLELCRHSGLSLFSHHCLSGHVLLLSLVILDQCVHLL